MVPVITPPISFSYWICTDLNDHPDEPGNGGIPPIGEGIGTLFLCTHSLFEVKTLFHQHFPLEILSCINDDSMFM